MVYLMIPVAILTWLLDLAFEAVLWLAGIVVVTYLVTRKDWVDDVPSVHFDDGRTRRQWRPRWAQLWGNDEDGIEGAAAWWLEQTKDWSERHRAWIWSAQRNPIGNLRFVKPFGFLIDPAKVHYVGNCMDPDAAFAAQPGSYRYFAWCGWRTGTWFIFPGIWPYLKTPSSWWKVWELRAWFAPAWVKVRLGWKIIPKDIHGLAIDDYRRKGCGTALQFGKQAS